MKIALLRATCSCVGVLLLLSSSKAVTYTLTILDQPGFARSEGWGISQLNQVGTIYQSGNQDAALWSGSSASVVSLTPAGRLGSEAFGASGSFQVGHSFLAGGVEHAALWAGSAASVVDLNPAAVSASTAYAVDGTSQVGVMRGTATGGQDHAVLWNGSAASAIDLNPSGYTSSESRGVSGASQVGFVSGTATGGKDHAALWNGTTASFVDLNPAGFDFSRVNAASGPTQVGVARLGFTNDRAILWQGISASAIDLTPPTFNSAIATGISGLTQVGFGYSPANGLFRHALLWQGTAASYVDLHQFVLGSGFVQSTANGIAPNGSIIGTLADSTGRSYAAMWTPVPEPAPCALAACGFLGALLLHNHRRRSRYF